MSNMNTEQPSLDACALRANAEHQSVLQCVSGVLLSHVRSAGEALLAAKAQLEHGEWRNWLRANIRYSSRKARAYMRIAKGWPEIQQSGSSDAIFSLRDALALLAAERKKKAAAPVSLITHISNIGGIAWGEIEDLTGESRPISRPGLFRKTGNALDDLATRLRDDGFDIPGDSADGGVQALRDMIRDELDGQRHYSFAEQERVLEREHDARRVEPAGVRLLRALLARLERERPWERGDQDVPELPETILVQITEMRPILVEWLNLLGEAAQVELGRRHQKPRYAEREREGLRA